MTQRRSLNLGSLQSSQCYPGPSVVQPAGPSEPSSLGCVHHLCCEVTGWNGDRDVMAEISRARWQAIDCFLSNQQGCKYSGRDSLRKTGEVHSPFWCWAYLRVAVLQLHLGSTWEGREHLRFHQTKYTIQAWSCTERLETLKVVSIISLESLPWVRGGNHGNSWGLLWREKQFVALLFMEFLGCSGPRRKMIVWWPALWDVTFHSSWTGLCPSGLWMVVCSWLCSSTR